MKQVWRRRMASRFLKFFLLLLCQPVCKVFSQIESQDILDEEVSQCELSLESIPLQGSFSKDPAYGRNYLVRHLLDKDTWLTREREQELVSIYQNEENKKKKEGALILLLSNYIRPIRNLAYRISSSWGREDLAEDLMQDAIFRITRRLKKYDPEKGSVFTFLFSYLPKRMNSQMADYVSPVLVSDSDRRQLKAKGENPIPLAVSLTTDESNNNNTINGNEIEDTYLIRLIESWVEAEERVEQLKDFILSIGDTPRQRYILRHRIFSFDPESFQSIAKKFETHPSGDSIRREEKQLIEKISVYLGNGSFTNRNEIFIEMHKMITEDGLPRFVIDNKMNWQTEDLAIQIKYLIQEMDSTPEQRSSLKNQQAENIAREMELDEIDRYILRYRLIEEPKKRYTSADIGNRFGISYEAILQRERKILRKLRQTKFTSPELREITERINWETKRKNTQTLVLNANEKDQIAEIMAEQAGLNKVEQHILRYWLMEEPGEQQTLKMIGEAFNLDHSTISYWKNNVLKKITEAKFTSTKPKRTVDKILLEEEQKKRTVLTAVDKSELDQEAENIAKQAEDLILEVGNTPLQIHILRYNIFSLYPESIQSIAKKFGSYTTRILHEESQLLKTLNELLGNEANEANMTKHQIFRKVVNRIRKGKPFLFTDINELENLAGNIAHQAKLKKIEQHILIYRFLEEPDKQQSLSVIGKIFDISTTYTRDLERSMLQKLQKTKFSSPELRAIVTEILQIKKQQNKSTPVVNNKQLTQEWGTLPQAWKDDDTYRYIFEYRLLIDPENRKTLAEVAKISGVSMNTAYRREQAILKILKERGLVSFQ